jgi:hypothetical protein
MNRREAIRTMIGSAAAGLLGKVRIVEAGSPSNNECRAVLGLDGCAALFGGGNCIAAPNRVRHLKLHAAPPAPTELPWKDRQSINTSGLSGFDAALSGAVLKPLTEVFGVRPSFAYYDETQEGGKPNAIASPDTARLNRDGSVLFGLKLLNALLDAPGGDYAAMAVCAHEFGHIVQFQRRVQSRIAAQLPCMCIELHADFLAGYFIGTAMRGRLGSADIQQIGRAWSAWETQSCSHGSNIERVAAIEAGYFNAQSSSRAEISSAVESGITYLARYRPT